jgi:hypothetical protein
MLEPRKCGALLIRALLSRGLMTGKRSVFVSVSRSRVRVCIRLLTAPDFLGFANCHRDQNGRHPFSFQELPDSYAHHSEGRAFLMLWRLPSVAALCPDQCSSRRSSTCRPVREIARAARQRSRCAPMAGEEIDRLGDPLATDEERQLRKRRLIKGPQEFRVIRSNRAKIKPGFPG